MKAREKLVHSRACHLHVDADHRGAILFDTPNVTRLDLFAIGLWISPSIARPYTPFGPEG
jgi:hypothetical protein